MAAAPDDDARRTLAELEAKLRELERELLRGYEPEAVEADPFAAPDEPEPEMPPPAALHPDELEAEPAASEAEAEPAAPPIAFPPEPEPEPAAFDAAEWTTPDTREHAQPEPAAEPGASFEAELESAREPADEPGSTYDGGLAREPLPAFEPAPTDAARAARARRSRAARARRSRAAPPDVRAAPEPLPRARPLRLRRSPSRSPSPSLASTTTLWTPRTACSPPCARRSRTWASRRRA